MITLNEKDKKRLLDEKILWLSTVDSTCVPHLVPIWFVFEKRKIYIYTSDKSVKFSNIKTNPKISFCLEDGHNPLCGLGTVNFRRVDQKLDSKIIDFFKQKYDWEILKDERYNILLEIDINKLFMRKK